MAEGANSDRTNSDRAAADETQSNWIRADWAAPANIIAGTTLRANTDPEIPAVGEPYWLNQVHGNRVVRADVIGSPPDADASISGADAGLVCVVRTADCLPVLMCSRDGAEFAAAHAGWRGLSAGVIENTLNEFASEPRDILVWLGPAISQAAFEVGDEVLEAFQASMESADDCFVANSRGRWQADLFGLARRRLLAAGVTEVSGGGFCTFEDADRFYSYRRGKDSGRMFSFVGARTLEKTPRAAS